MSWCMWCEQREAGPDQLHCTGAQTRPPSVALTINFPPAWPCCVSRSMLTLCEQWTGDSLPFLWPANKSSSCSVSQTFLTNVFDTSSSPTPRHFQRCRPTTSSLSQRPAIFSPKCGFLSPLKCSSGVFLACIIKNLFFNLSFDNFQFEAKFLMCSECQWQPVDGVALPAC